MFDIGQKIFLVCLFFLLHLFEHHLHGDIGLFKLLVGLGQVIRSFLDQFFQLIFPVS